MARRSTEPPKLREPTSACCSRTCLKPRTAHVEWLKRCATPVARRAAIQLVLDDATFMRPRKGMVPARVIEDAAIEAMLRMNRDPALKEQLAIVDKVLAEVKKEDGGE